MALLKKHHKRPHVAKIIFDLDRNEATILFETPISPMEAELSPFFNNIHRNTGEEAHFKVDVHKIFVKTADHMDGSVEIDLKKAYQDELLRRLEKTYGSKENL